MFSKNQWIFLLQQAGVDQNVAYQIAGKLQKELENLKEEIKRELKK